MKIVVSLCWALALLSISLCLQSCDPSGPTYPIGVSTEAGSLRISVLTPSGSEDTLGTNSYTVELDGRSYGSWTAPCVIPYVPVGAHDVVVFNHAWSSPATRVEIKTDREISVSLSLLVIGPYVGNVAPAFSASSIEGQGLTLKALRGKVVVLAFFGSVG